MYRLPPWYLVLVALAVAPSPAAAQTAVELMWQQTAPSDVSGYRVSVDGAWHDYGTTLVGAGGSCVCTVTLSLATGSHTLIVAAYNANGETASAPLMHTVAGSSPTAPAAPGAPASPAPASASTVGSTSPTLTWSASGASTYDLKLSTANPPVKVVAAALTASSYQGMLTARTKYFWQVVAKNSAGSTGGPVWSFTTGAASPTGALPAPWTAQDIGRVGVSGSGTLATGTFTVKGAGLDIWGTADAFQYVSQPLTGDGEIIARVMTLQNTNANAKAGIMMRASAAASAAHVMLDSAVDGSIELITRSSSGSAATYVTGAAQSRPIWLKLARAGTLVTASVSYDGQAWSVLGSTNGTGLASAGLAVTSADTSVLNPSTFDSVSVTAKAAKATKVPKAR
jgi:hypothetical protein